MRRKEKIREMNRKGVTLSIVFEAQGANYGEGFGNISVLKKLSRGDGNLYSYISRQALRYNIIQQLGWDNTPVILNKKVVQFDPNASIKDYPEIDLFGYMKTTSKSDNKKENEEGQGKNDGKGGATTRSAVVRLSNAIALEPYKSDMDFLNNMGLAKRRNFENGIAQSEIQRTAYAYTVTIDLDRVGIEGNDEIPNKEKADRVCKLLDTLLFLYRDIKGRRENLSPIFVIGGRYERKNPYFDGRIKLKGSSLDINCLKNIIEGDKDIKENTRIGYIDGMFSNNEEIVKSLNPITVTVFFKALKKEVEDYYA
jgi:CRISPR-associated protein Cst2